MEFYPTQDCCEGCKLGLVAGAMGLYCEFQSLRLALGPPWDSSLTKCCLEAGGKAGYPTTGPTIRPTTPPGLYGIVFSLRKDYLNVCVLYSLEFSSKATLTLRVSRSTQFPNIYETGK